MQVRQGNITVSAANAAGVQDCVTSNTVYEMQKTNANKHTSGYSLMLPGTGRQRPTYRHTSQFVSATQVRENGDALLIRY